MDAISRRIPPVVFYNICSSCSSAGQRKRRRVRRERAISPLSLRYARNFLEAAGGVKEDESDASNKSVLHGRQAQEVRAHQGHRPGLRQRNILLW